MFKYNLEQATDEIVALQKRFDAGEKVTIDDLKQLVKKTQATPQGNIAQNHTFVLYHGENKADVS